MVVQKFQVRNQRLSKFNTMVIASNSYGYLKCEFNFITDDWKDVSVKMANFYYKGRNYPRLIDENNQVEVPKEVIHIPSFTVSVFGGGITTNKITLNVEDSGIAGGYDDNSIYFNEIINKLTAEIDSLNATKADNIIVDEETNKMQLTANGVPIGDTVDLCSCGIKSFEVDDEDNITVTLIDGRIIQLGQIEGASGVTFTPHIDENLILSWTNDGGLENPEPVDLNPYDEWVDDETISDYVWEEE